MGPGRFSRRSFLVGAGGVAAGAGLATAIGLGDDRAEAASRFVLFHGPHQNGIAAQPTPAVGLLAAFTLVAPNRGGLRDLLRDLSDEIEGLMAGRPPQQRDPSYPPADSGILGAEPAADDLSVVVSVGASMFDERWGLAARRPKELVKMPFVSNDRLDPDRSHGDLLLTIHAEHQDTVTFALRQLMRRTRRGLVLRWVLDGYNRRAHPSHGGTGSGRNLMGFVDGTANIDSSDVTVMDRHVWVGADDGEPEWTTGGSYHVVRVIRMFVEFWDRTALAEQESIIGRHKLSGAPLGMRRETDDPGYPSDPGGARISLDAHIRRANPRTGGATVNPILRRGFSYTRGYDGAGRLDQGLAFVSYQRSIERGFLAVQRRLNGERLEEYILPEGGGYFFALPGAPSRGSFLGEQLLA